jgi:predicted acetyltransferase
MSVSLRDASEHPDDRAWIERVYRDYLDDLGLLNTGVFPALGEIGHREPDQTQRWYTDPSSILLTILDSMNPVGFALLARQTHASRTADFRMTDFFIARDARRRGVGQGAVRLILDRFAGRWEIVEYSRNKIAVGFWRRVIAAYTKGDYQERVTNGEVRQTFRSGRAT